MLVEDRCLDEVFPRITATGAEVEKSHAVGDVIRGSRIRSLTGVKSALIKVNVTEKGVCVGTVLQLSYLYIKTLC